jgi:hypothetical protein
MLESLPASVCSLGLLYVERLSLSADADSTRSIAFLMKMHVLVRPAMLIVVVLTGLVAACFRREEPAPSRSPTGGITPNLQSQDEPRSTSEDTLSAQLTAAGVPTMYRASFKDGQLALIVETRSAVSSAAKGEYEFESGRLLRYSGQALQGAPQLELAFDLQGRVTRARSDDREARADEISAIRSRAQLLRSHALAQRATRLHTMQ